MAEPLDDLLDLRQPPPGGLRRLRAAVDVTERPRARWTVRATLLTVTCGMLALGVWWATATGPATPPAPAPLKGRDDIMVLAMRGPVDATALAVTVDGKPVDAQVSADGRVLMIRRQP